MTRLGLALSAFRRHIGRTVFTVLSVAMAFAIFTVLAAIQDGMTGYNSLAQARRLDTDSAINSPLPVSYGAIIKSVPGVVAVAPVSGFPGYFRDPKDRFNVWVSTLPTTFTIFPEILVPDDQKQAMLHDKQGAIAAAALAEKMGWHIGETIPVQGGPPQKNGSSTWFFHLDGLAHSSVVGENEHFLLVNFDYFNDGLAPSPTKDMAGDFNILVDDPKDLDRVARAIDARFTNASPDTRTEANSQESISAMRQFGDIGAILTSVGFAVFASMLLITGNTMVNSVRERLGEFAMMRALGFGRRQLALIVFRECAILIGLGAALGLLAGWGVTQLMAPVMTTLLRSFHVTWLTVLFAVILAMIFAVITGLLPTRRVAGMSVASALRRM
jgi:putative ABC transport system permease protein